MKKHPLDEKDHALVAAAMEAVEKPVRELWGKIAPARVGAALRMDDGRVFSSVNLVADIKSLSVCAEPIAIAQARLHTDRTIECIVAVYHMPEQKPRVISPCGQCREFITDYGPDCDVILREPGTEELFKVKAKDLLPYKYVEYWRHKELL